MKTVSKVIVVAAVGVAILAGAGTTTNDAEAAVIRSYADGPVLYLNKAETRYVGKASVAAAFGFLAGLSGGWAGPAAVAATSIADTYIDYQVARGYCLEVKMWWWNPKSLRVKFYSWWPCK